MKNTKIAYCKIFPSIGIARVGDSTNPIENEGWFVAPEFDNDERPENFSFKDSSGKIKRQGAKFRLFAFDKDDNPIQEITAADAEITWTVELANKKAAWFNFE
ncbi:MAG: LodA/GoxA family CTQ-dependent oxidase [Saprospiraceae bacterium]|nr:LodA/GoxA family CTQ-dependent oxidase [Saprospiraceae bacterium]